MNRALASARKQAAISITLARTTGPASTSLNGLGAQGKPAGSSLTALRPSALTTPPSASRITNVGMPLTLKRLDSAAFASRLQYGSDSQGIEALYSMNMSASPARKSAAREHTGR